MVPFQMKMKSMGTYFKFTPASSICTNKNKQRIPLKKQILVLTFSFRIYFLKILFIHERHRGRGRDTGRGRCRDPAPSQILIKNNSSFNILHMQQVIKSEFLSLQVECYRVFCGNVLKLNLSSKNKSIVICKNSFEFTLKMSAFANFVVCVLCPSQDTF